MGLSTDQKGAIAELAIAKAAIELGIGVYRPVGEGDRYDLIFDFGDRLDRVQCKWAPLHGDVISSGAIPRARTATGLRRRGTRRARSTLSLRTVRSFDRCFYLTARAPGRKLQITLRLAPSRNNQQPGINWATSFAFEGLQSRLGP